MKLRTLSGILLALATARVHAQAAPTPEPDAADPAQPAPAEGATETEAQAPPAPELTLEQSEMALLGLEPSQQAVDKSFRFYGFADFTSFHPLRVNATGIALGRRQSFYIGNINLYLSRNLSETFRTLAEVRLTYLPNGSIKASGSSIEFENTVVLDYADNSRVNRWGGIIMQRIYLEWTLHRFITVRGGQFLTPFGIWNVDHGSPAYIPVQRPYLVNSNSGYFPERQTGLEILGRWDISNAIALGYHFTLSNGGGSVPEYRDFDKNKAVGARLYLEHNGTGYLRVGASGYYGRDTDAYPVPKLTPGAVKAADHVNSQFDALSLAGDLLYKVRGLHLQAEVATQQRRYTEDGRVASQVYFAPAPVGFPRDTLSFGGYLLLAYELPWYALTPYTMVQHNRETVYNGFTGLINDLWSFHGGLNVHPIDEVVFKLEYVYVRFVDGGPVLGRSISYLQLQAAWAF